MARGGAWAGPWISSLWPSLPAGDVGFDVRANGRGLTARAALVRLHATAAGAVLDGSGSAEWPDVRQPLAPEATLSSQVHIGERAGPRAARRGGGDGDAAVEPDRRCRACGRVGRARARAVDGAGAGRPEVITTRAGRTARALSAEGAAARRAPPPWNGRRRSAGRGRSRPPHRRRATPRGRGGAHDLTLDAEGTRTGGCVPRSGRTQCRVPAASTRASIGCWSSSRRAPLPSPLDGSLLAPVPIRVRAAAGRRSARLVLAHGSQRVQLAGHYTKTGRIDARLRLEHVSTHGRSCVRSVPVRLAVPSIRVDADLHVAGTTRARRWRMGGSRRRWRARDTARRGSPRRGATRRDELRVDARCSSLGAGQASLAADVPLASAHEMRRHRYQSR